MDKYKVNSIKYEELQLYVTQESITNCVIIEGSLYILSPDMMEYLTMELNKQPAPVVTNQNLSRQQRRHAEKLLRRKYPEKVATAV